MEDALRKPRQDPLDLPVEIVPMVLVHVYENSKVKAAAAVPRLSFYTFFDNFLHRVRTILPSRTRTPLT
jgi:hypothetical protein